ncbi:MAG: alpha/beta fold hydrolase [Acidobacteriota bacterium]
MPGSSALVLLGGMMCDERLWAPQIDDLRRRTRDLLVGDLTRSSSVEGMARDVLAEAPERFALAGLSMGGIVAFEVWRQAPERISHLALFDTNAAAEVPERQARRADEIRIVRNGGLRELMIEQFKPHYLGARSRANAALLEVILDMAVDLGSGVFERQSLALRDRPDSRTTLGTITCSTLVVGGREDALCPPSYHELIAAGIPRAQLTLLENCGHMTPLERPRATSRLLHQLIQATGDLPASGRTAEPRNA